MSTSGGAMFTRGGAELHPHQGEVVQDLAYHGCACMYLVMPKVSTSAGSRRLLHCPSSSQWGQVYLLQPACHRCKGG